VVRGELFNAQDLEDIGTPSRANPSVASSAVDADGGSWVDGSDSVTTHSRRGR
jgi:hypothetical protein